MHTCLKKYNKEVVKYSNDPISIWNTAAGLLPVAEYTGNIY